MEREREKQSSQLNYHLRWCIRLQADVLLCWSILFRTEFTIQMNIYRMWIVMQPMIEGEKQQNKTKKRKQQSIHLQMCDRSQQMMIWVMIYPDKFVFVLFTRWQIIRWKDRIGSTGGCTSAVDSMLLWRERASSVCERERKRGREEKLIIQFVREVGQSIFLHSFLTGHTVTSLFNCSRSLPLYVFCPSATRLVLVGLVAAFYSSHFRFGRPVQPTAYKSIHPSIHSSAVQKRVLECVCRYNNRPRT